MPLSKAEQDSSEIRKDFLEAMSEFKKVEADFSERTGVISEMVEPLSSLLDERVQLIARLIQAEADSSSRVFSQADLDYELNRSILGLKYFLDDGHFSHIEIEETGIWFSGAYSFVPFWMIFSTEDELSEIIHVRAEIGRLKNAFFSKKRKIVELELELEHIKTKLLRKYQWEV